VLVAYYIFVFCFNKSDETIQNMRKLTDLWFEIKM